MARRSKKAQVHRGEEEASGRTGWIGAVHCVPEVVPQCWRSQCPPESSSEEKLVSHLH